MPLKTHVMFKILTEYLQGQNANLKSTIFVFFSSHHEENSFCFFHLWLFSPSTKKRNASCPPQQNTRLMYTVKSLKRPLLHFPTSSFPLFHLAIKSPSVYQAVFIFFYFFPSTKFYYEYECSQVLYSFMLRAQLLFSCGLALLYFLRQIRSLLDDSLGHHTFYMWN